MAARHYAPFRRLAPLADAGALFGTLHKTDDPARSNNPVFSPAGGRHEPGASRALGWALSGAGLLCIEATAVEPEGRITPGDVGLWDDTTEAALQPVGQTIRRYSPVKVAIQLAHAGRKASSRVPWEGGSFMAPEEGGWETVGPSALPQKEGEPSPIALDNAGLERVRRASEAATRRAERLGVDAIEVHGAHGYLLHEFLSPLANSPTDSYGGSLENRFRFPWEMFAIAG